MVITPDKRALAGLGATGWAVGSHACNGNTPALAPKPIKPHNKAIWTKGNALLEIVFNEPPNTNSPKLLEKWIPATTAIKPKNPPPNE